MKKYIYNKKEKRGKREKKKEKKEKSVNGGTVFCLFYVTIDDTSVIYDYVTTHRCAGGLGKESLGSFTFSP